MKSENKITKIRIANRISGLVRHIFINRKALLLFRMNIGREGDQTSLEGDELARSLYVRVSITEERDIRVHERKEGES